MKSYRNFDLELTDHAGGGGSAETFRVRVAFSPAGEQRPREAAQVELDRGLRDTCGRLDRRELDLAGLLQLGKTLGGLLLPPVARSFWDRSLAKLEEGEGLRVRLKLDSWALADLPWEYVWLPARDAAAGQEDASGFLALDPRISLVRYELLSESVGGLDPVGDGPLRLVAVMASPSDLPPLDVLREANALREALKLRPDVELDLVMEGSFPALERALHRGAHMFHFAGHGRFDRAMAEKAGTVEGQGFLLFNDAAGRSVEVAADRVVVNLRGRVRLAVLGACLAARRDPGNPWLGIAPALVRGGLPAVVAMQATVHDKSAVAFSARCYETLADGGSIDDAVTAGRLAIFNEGGPADRDWGVPVLYLRADSGVLFPRAEEPKPDEVRPLGPRSWVNVALSAVAAVLLIAGSILFAYPRLPEGGWRVVGISVGTVLSAVLAWVLWLAGDDVRTWVRRLLPKPGVTVGLAAAVVALLGLDAKLYVNRPRVVRVIPGIRLTNRLPESGEPGAADPFVYTLRAWQGDRGDEPDWVLNDLRTSGGALGTSEWMERLVLERESKPLHDRLDDHLSRKLPPKEYNEFHAKFLELWNRDERGRPAQAGPRRRPGEPLHFELLKFERMGSQRPVERVPLQYSVEVEKGVEIVIVESQNE